MHEMHRSRMKQRFLKEGLDTFEDHQVLEFILFYALPRVDTNEIAHVLLDRFGSFHKVMDAPIEELQKISGIGEHAAIFMKVIPELARKYFLDSLPKGEVYDSVDKIGEYLVRTYIGVTTEKIYLLLFDNGYRMITSIMMMEGSVNSAWMPVRDMVEEIIKYNASMAVIAHNHPGGITAPSQEDINTTMRLINVFEPIDCVLLEHIIVSDREFLPIIYSTPSLRSIRNKKF